MKNQLGGEEGCSLAVLAYKCRQAGVSTAMVFTLDYYQGWQELEVTVDSGACDTVMPFPLCSDIPLRESEQQRSCFLYTYDVADESSVLALCDARSSS